MPARILRDLGLVRPVTESSGVTGFAALEPGLLLTSPSGLAGTSIEAAVLLTNPGDSLAGWRWGVCHDNGVSVEAGSIEEGAAIAGLDFDLELITVDANGWTVSALLDDVSGNVLEAGTGLDMYRATYVLETPGLSAVSFCETLGDPAVTVRWVLAGGGEVEPATFDGVIAVRLPFPFAFGVEAPAVSYDPDEVSAEIAFAVDLTIEEDPANSEFPSDTQGFSMGLAHDGGFLEVTDAYPSGVLAALDGGSGPDLVEIDLAPPGGTGVTVTVTYGAAADVFLEFESLEPVITLEYRLTGGALASLEGDLDGAATALEWSNELGVPPVVNGIVLDGADSEVGFEDATVLLLPEGVLLPFLRGDCNGNGDVFALTDGIFLLEWSFLDGREPPCLDAADVDDSGTISGLLDALYLLEWNFTDGESPPAPGPERCGPDLSADGLGCAASPDACL